MVWEVVALVVDNSSHCPLSCNCWQCFERHKTSTENRPLGEGVGGEVRFNWLLWDRGFLATKVVFFPLVKLTTCRRILDARKNPMGWGWFGMTGWSKNEISLSFGGRECFISSWMPYGLTNGLLPFPGGKVVLGCCCSDANVIAGRGVYWWNLSWSRNLISSLKC